MNKTMQSTLTEKIGFIPLNAKIIYRETDEHGYFFSFDLDKQMDYLVLVKEKEGQIFAITSIKG